MDRDQEARKAERLRDVTIDDESEAPQPADTAGGYMLTADQVEEMLAIERADELLRSICRRLDAIREREPTR